MCQSVTSRKPDECGGGKQLAGGSTRARDAGGRPGSAGSWASKYDPYDENLDMPSKRDIKNAIPRHCFNRSALHGFVWIAIDTLQAAVCVWFAYTFLKPAFPSSWFSLEALTFVLGWNFYAFWMGTVLTGHWVIAHECGHMAFSPNQHLNDFVGYILHQALLVPYFAWQFTHAKHHKRTNHLVDGESHVPTTAVENGVGPNGEKLSAYAKLHEWMDDGVFAGFQIFTHLVIGWPIYLAGYASTGRLGADGKPLDGDIADHYRPWSRMFPANLYYKIMLSTIGVIGLLCYLTYLSFQHGFLPVCLYYWFPYLWTNAWLVLYTWLQHNDPSVPQYGPDEWTFVRGALSTIDRPYGIFDHFHHKIGSTHVAHHLFHEIPFYNGDEATAAIKEFLGPMYNFDPTPWWQAMWKVANTCHYVEGTDGIQYPKSMNDLPRTKAKTGAKEKAC